MRTATHTRPCVNVRAQTQNMSQAALTILSARNASAELQYSRRVEYKQKIGKGRKSVRWTVERKGRWVWWDHQCIGRGKVVGPAIFCLVIDWWKKVKEKGAWKRHVNNKMNDSTVWCVSYEGGNVSGYFPSTSAWETLQSSL
ncbi:hypothetical protein VNO77_00951 [Canavalia gladiata]|uniref:Uncharacterized protein n=1 Tax=Canavalia gladiata TaxID=3824 RepID=A0AAN9MV72_CANGL